MASRTLKNHLIITTLTTIGTTTGLVYYINKTTNETHQQLVNTRKQSEDQYKQISNSFGK